MMNGLAKVDDYCGKLHIGIVKINDLELVTEYNLGELPALVYYRHTIPILYEGEAGWWLVVIIITLSDHRGPQGGGRHAGVAGPEQEQRGRGGRDRGGGVHHPPGHGLGGGEHRCTLL